MRLRRQLRIGSILKHPGESLDTAKVGERPCNSSAMAVSLPYPRAARRQPRTEFS